MKQYIIFFIIIILLIFILLCIKKNEMENYTPFCNDKPENECNSSPGCRWIENECIAHNVYHRPWTFNWNEEYKIDDDTINDGDYIANWRYPTPLPKDTVAINYRMPRSFSSIHGKGQLSFGRITDLNRNIYKQRVAGNRSNTGGIASGQLRILSGKSRVGIPR